MNQQPEILYKYRGASKSHLRNWLIKHEVFFADPDDFNDPFDIKIRKKPELLPEEDFILQNVYRYNKKYKTQSFDFLWNLAAKDFYSNLEKDKDYYKNIAIQARNQGIYEIRRGVLCLSEEKENILMRSHYSDSNKGFCIGYDKKILEESIKKSLELLGLFKVKYSNEYPTLLPTIGHSVIQIRDKLAIKSNLWSYEKEWRFIIHNENRKSISVPKHAIKEIIMGAKIDRCLESSIRKIHQKYYEHATLSRIEPDDSEFKLNTIKIN